MRLLQHLENILNPLLSVLHVFGKQEQILFKKIKPNVRFIHGHGLLFYHNLDMIQNVALTPISVKILSPVCEIAINVVYVPVCCCLGYEIIIL